MWGEEQKDPCRIEFWTFGQQSQGICPLGSGRLEPMGANSITKALDPTYELC
jgi:hypothetical protein